MNVLPRSVTLRLYLHAGEFLDAAWNFAEVRWCRLAASMGAKRTRPFVGAGSAFVGIRPRRAFRGNEVER